MRQKEVKREKTYKVTIEDSKKSSKRNELSILEDGKVFLDGTELKQVTKYKIVNSADKPAELTVTLLVNVGQFGFEPKR